MNDLHELDKYRATKAERKFYGRDGDGGNGVFVLPFHPDIDLYVIASNGGAWDHVSVSLSDRCPTWEEMSFVAQLFFAAEEHAMQLHVPGREHLNLAENCLHWWRPQNKDIPLPPIYMV